MDCGVHDAQLHSIHCVVQSHVVEMVDSVSFVRLHQFVQSLNLHGICGGGSGFLTHPVCGVFGIHADDDSFLSLP
jgi:hypothetical protein